MTRLRVVRYKKHVPEYEDGVKDEGGFKSEQCLGDGSGSTNSPGIVLGAAFRCVSGLQEPSICSRPISQECCVAELGFVEVPVEDEADRHLLTKVDICEAISPLN